MQPPTERSLVAFSTNYWPSALATLRLSGPAHQAGLELVHGNELEQVYPERVAQADIVVIQRDFPRNRPATREITARARLASKPVVFDLDDLLLELPEDHPDRETFFYAEALLPMLETIVAADLVTASTPALCEYLRPFNPNTLLAPNSLDDRLWPFRPPRSPAAGIPVVVGYMGGGSHLPDLERVAPALLRICDHYADQVVLRFLGVQPPPELLARSNVSWSPTTTYDYSEFAAQLLQQGYDIAIAPLNDNLFNRCKSPLKVLEYSAVGAVGVYSNLEPYSQVVVQGENGFLASTLEEWEEYLSRLVDDAGLRSRLALAAQEAVRRDHMLSQRGQAWRSIWDQAYSLRSPAPDARPALLNTFLRISAQVQDWQSHLKEHEQAQSIELAQKMARLSVLEQELAAIYGSNSWKLLRRLGRAPRELK
ncbi:MAG TPA: glycosyltransferase [Anaerolineales bacterium]